VLVQGRCSRSVDFDNEVDIVAVELMDVLAYLVFYCEWCILKLRPIH
jgi:hypothetical protein